MSKVFIALGSNIDAEQNMKKAASLLRTNFPDIRFSSVYQTTAVGYEDQDDFLNAVGTFESERTPEEIHTILQSIEQSLGKSPPFIFGPRTIDLDLLLYGNEVHPGLEEWQNQKLFVPHPRMHERRFVLEPLLDLIDPTSTHPVLRSSWGAFLEKTKDQQVEKTALIL